LSEFEGKEKLETLSQLLVDCSDHEEEFWSFALENEDDVRIALYAKNVTDGYAVPTEKLIAECDEVIELLQNFLDEAGSDE
jgi:hypothetical protein